MGRRRRRRNRNRDDGPARQGELLDGVDGADDEVGGGEGGAGASGDPGDAGGPDDRGSTEEPRSGSGASGPGETSGEEDDPSPAGTVPAGASVVLGPEWPKRVAELEDVHDVEGALAVVRNERKQRPDDIALLQAEIRLLGSLGRFDAAAEPLDHLRSVATEPALVHRVAGVLLFRRGTYPEAMEELRASVAADESVGETFYYLGETLNRLGRVEEAMEALRRAVSLDPGLGRAYSTMGRLLDRKGEREEAALMHRKAREADR